MRWPSPHVLTGRHGATPNLLASASAKLAPIITLLAYAKIVFAKKN
jgi:hypothetical protein